MQNSVQLLEHVLHEVFGLFEDDTVRNVAELLNAGEQGVALEVLCSQLVEYKIQISEESKKMLMDAASQMGVSISEVKEISVK